jgi:hypothetical protein
MTITHITPREQELMARVAELEKAQAKPLDQCTAEDLVNHHAFVYGRCRIWLVDLTDTAEREYVWSKTTWWKAMHYPHRGSPRYQGCWGLYAGNSGATNPGDAELTHFMPLPPHPAIDDAMQSNDKGAK